MQGKYEKSLIIDKYGRKIGIIGVMLATTNVSLRDPPQFEIGELNKIVKCLENRFNRKVAFL